VAVDHQGLYDDEEEANPSLCWVGFLASAKQARVGRIPVGAALRGTRHFSLFMWVASRALAPRVDHHAIWRIPMKSLTSKVQRFLASEDGPTAVEYAVMLALIVIVCLTAIQAIGTNANQTFQDIADQLD